MKLIIGQVVVVAKSGRNLEMLKHNLYDKIIIKPEEIPQSYFQSVIQRHKEEGRPIESIPEEIKKELAQTLIESQKGSLDTWVNYFVSPDAKYPSYLKYHALRSILVMGSYDKGKKKFTERSKTGKSVNQFPELIRDALAFVFDAIEKKENGNLASIKFAYGIKPEEQEEFLVLVKQDANFGRLYAWAVDKITPISEELLQETKGQWVTYPQGSDAKPLVDSLTQYGTGWCIRGEAMARRYLSESELMIYYSNDKSGQPIVPRIVIVTRNGRIDEARGVAKEEHWDPYITDVVEEKLKKLPDGEKFKKRVADMQRLTAIHRKCFSVDKKTGIQTYLNSSFSKEELRFLYEADGKIEGFGYQIQDPRIKELRSKRSLEEDMSIIFECEKSQIAKNVNEINENTKAYVGPLLHHDRDGKIIPIFKLFQKYNLEHVYTSFPEGRITFEDVMIGGKSAKELQKEMKGKNMELSSYAEDMMESKDFITLKNPQTLNAVKLKVQDLGFSKNENPTTDQIYQSAEDLGLNLCPAEIGPHKRLKDLNQPLNDVYYIAMKQIAGRGGGPRVFRLYRGVGGLWLAGYWADPGLRWFPELRFVFSPSK